MLEVYFLAGLSSKQVFKKLSFLTRFSRRKSIFRNKIFILDRRKNFDQKILVISDWFKGFRRLRSFLCRVYGLNLQRLREEKLEILRIFIESLQK